jgi:hypothetical protein
MKKSIKILIFTGICIAIGTAIYFIFFYKKSAYQIATDLNLYTGVTGEDNLLDNMINQALTGGGTIATGNLEWELNDAAQRLNTNQVNEYAKVNGKTIPASALLTTIDTTHDYYNGSPDVPGSAAQLTQANVDRYDEILRDEPTWTPEEAAAYYSADLGQEYTVAEFEEARALLSAEVKPGDAYIPQYSLSILWELLGDYKQIANTQGIIK